MELFKITAGVDLLHVPFRGAGPAVIDVIGGHTKAINATISTLLPHIHGGKLRAIGVSGKKRSAVLPEIPTIEEGGVPGYDAGNWIGIAAPTGTPNAIVARLHKEVTAMLDLPEIQKQIASDGSEILRMSSSEFAKYMDNEMAKWGKVVKTAGIPAQ
jgi:tripartite-type tricarboxylate transporter receptor subunit TctC